MNKLLFTESKHAHRHCDNKTRSRTTLAELRHHFTAFSDVQQHQSTSSDALIHSGGQETPHLLCSINVQSCVHKRSPTVPILNHMRLVHALLPSLRPVSACTSRSDVIKEHLTGPSTIACPLQFSYGGRQPEWQRPSQCPSTMGPETLVKTRFSATMTSDHTSTRMTFGTSITSDRISPTIIWIKWREQYILNVTVFQTVHR